MAFQQNAKKPHRQDFANGKERGSPIADSFADNVAWLEAFKEKEGRPLRVLHVGNIANNAYLNAKMLRSIGVEADVLSYHYNHVMGLPEWEDVELHSGHGDDNNPRFASRDLEGYNRPSWFFHGSLIPCIHDIEARYGSSDQKAPLAQRVMHSPIRLIERRVNRRLAILLSMLTMSPRLTVIKTGRYVEKRWGWRLAPLVGLACRIARLPSALVTASRLTVTGTALHLKRAYVGLRDLCSASRSRLVRWMTTLRSILPLVPCLTFIKTVRILGRCWISLTSWRPAPLVRLADWVDELDKNPRPLLSWATNDGSDDSRSTTRIASPLQSETLLKSNTQSELKVLPEPEVPSELNEALESEVSSEPNKALEPETADHAIARIMKEFQDCFPYRADQMSPDEVLPYYMQAQLMRAAFRHYDIVQCYATDPLHAMLSGTRPYVAFEHGTLRDFTMGDNPIHRMTALAYRLSDHSFITNGDCLEYAKRLEIPRYNPIIHPVDVKQHRQDFGDDLVRLREEIGGDIVLFCPIRHDWSVKGTDVHLRALPLIKQHTGKRIRLVLARWGAQIADSERLLEESGCGEDVVWRPSMCRITMIKYLRVADVVLDQMALPHFGATAPQAIAAGTPVISSYDPESTRWIIPEPAPILPAFSPEDVAQAVLQALDPAWRADYKERARLWTDTYHHPNNVIHDHLKVYKRILDT